MPIIFLRELVMLVEFKCNLEELNCEKVENKISDFIKYPDMYDTHLLEEIKFPSTLEVELTACSTMGNQFVVLVNYENGEVSCQFQGTRHSLNDTGNVAGSLFHSLFGEEKKYYDDFYGNVWEYLPNEKLLNKVNVTRYESYRTDTNFWECGLTLALPTLPARPFTNKKVNAWISRHSQKFPKDALKRHLAKSLSKKDLWNLYGERIKTSFPA
jgi:hypothetical protein